MKICSRALPALLGGKRALVPPIFGLLATRIERVRWPELAFVDPFVGGGSVSLAAKRFGFRVTCNDLALRSAAIGRALIANGSTTLSEADVAVLLREPAGPFAHVAAERYYPSAFPLAHARLIDRALHNLASFPEPVRSLATVLLVKWMLRIQPMSMLSGTDAKAAFGGDLDRVSPRRLGHYLRAERLLGATAWRALAAEVNAGVFPGRGAAHQADCLNFLSHVRGDVVYLDPPYPGTTSYEREYVVLDDLLEGTVRETSRYSRSPASLPELFAACAHIPVWLVSLNNAALRLDELTAMVRRHRPVIRSLEVPYRHLASIASEVKNAANREFIILASD